MGPFRHAGGHHNAVRFPAIGEPLTDQPRAFGQKQAGLGAAFLSFQAFQGFDERV